MELVLYPDLFCSVDSLLENEKKGVLGNPDDIVSPEISKRIRTTVVEFLRATQRYFSLKLESFFAAVNILDAYLTRSTSVTFDNVQLVTLAAFSLAAKYHELSAPYPEDYVALLPENPTMDDLRIVEEDIFAVLGCNINVPCDIEYMRAMSTTNEAQKEEHDTSKYLLMVVVIYGSNFLPSVVTSAIRKLVSQVYNLEYVNYFNVPDDVIGECVHNLIKIFVNEPTIVSKVLGTIASKDANMKFLKTYNLICRIESPERKELNPKYYRMCYKGANFEEDITLDLLSPNVVPPGSKKLGEGTYGVVKQVQYKGKAYAVKKVKKIIINEGVLASSVIREMSILLSLDHPNIVVIKHITTDFRCMFLDLGWSDLKAWTKSQGPILLRDQVNLASQLVGAVEYIHSVGCLHRDIKPQNIIVYAKGRQVTFKLSDFGSARGCEIALRDNTFTHEICTLWYRSPEILLGSMVYNDRLDVWSLLCTLYECATGAPLFAGDSQFGQLIQIFMKLGTPHDQYETQFNNATQSWEDVSNLPNWNQSWPKFSKIEGLFDNDDMLSDCYKELFAQCFILDPYARPSSNTLRHIVDTYAK